MTLFHKIVNKLFLFCKIRNKEIKLNNETENKNCFVTLFLDENNKTNIEVGYKTSTNNAAELIQLSESFAEMLTYLSSASFKKSLFNQLVDKQKKSEDISEQIFIDNTIAFYDIIKQEISLSNKAKQPVVRPLSVFNVK
jgi:chaperonin GroEL (HSP60 family)